MPATKVASTLQAAASNAAGATTTSTTLNMSSAYAGFISAQITNGATAPTAPATVTVNVSPDGVTFYPYAVGTAQTAASVATDFVFDLPTAAMYANAVFGGNTGSAVTVAAQAQIETGI